MGKKSKIWDNAYDYLKGLDPNAKINFNKLNKSLKSKIKKILGSRTKKRGYNNGENTGSNRGNFTIAGISKLKNSGSQGPSKEYLKAQKIADQKAKQIAEELEKEYTEGMKQKSKNQKIKEQKKINRKRERIELAKLSEKENEEASTFIQNVQSDTYSKEQLMQNFCRITNEGIRDNIVVNAFIPRFMKNIQQIHDRLQEDGKLELLEKNYFEFEARYKKIFKVFHELQLKFYDIKHVQMDLKNLLKYLDIDFEQLDEFIKYINDNGFNYDIVKNGLKKWIETLKNQALEKFKDLNIESLQEEFTLEIQSDIEDNIEHILKEILLRMELLNLRVELTSDNYKKIIQKILFFTHEDKVLNNIVQLREVLKNNGNIKTFYEKYDKGYFTPEEKKEVEKLVVKLGEELESLKNEYDNNIKDNNEKEDNEKSDLDEEVFKLKNQLHHELESFKNSINNSNQNKNNLIKKKEEENKNLIKKKEEEIIEEKHKVNEKYVQIRKKLYNNYENLQDKLFDSFKNDLIIIHKNATQSLEKQLPILKKHFELKKKLEENMEREEFEGGGPNNGKKLIKSKWKGVKSAAKLLGEQEQKRKKNANDNAQFVKKIADAVGKRALENLPYKLEARRLLKEAIRLTEEAKLSKLNSKKSYAELFGEQVLKARSLAKEAKLSKWNSNKSAAKLFGEQEQKRKNNAKSVSNMADAAINKATSKKNNPWFSRYPLARQLSIKKEIEELIKKREAKRLAEEAKRLAEEAKKNKKPKEAEVAKPKESINKKLKEKILNLERERRRRIPSTTALVVSKKNYKKIFKDIYTKFFYPLEYLLGEYMIIITNYNELFTDELKIRDKLYFYIKIYNRLRSKDSNNFSCTLAYISSQILNIDDIEYEDESIQANFIEVFREYCDKTDFSNDISANASLGALKQSILQLKGNQVKQLLLGTSSQMTKSSNSSALVEYSQAAAIVRAKAQKAREDAQKAREDAQKARQKNRINSLFQEIQKKVQDNRELTLEELRNIRAIKEGLNKELIGTNNKQEIQNYLTKLNINTQISKEERRLRELEIVKILNTANKLPNDIPILDIKKMQDKLIRIKENNKDILTESNNEIIDELIKKFQSLYTKSTNSSTFDNKLANFEENKEKYRNSDNLEKLKELLEKVKLLLKIKGIPEKNIKQLKSDKKEIKKRIELLEKPNLQGIVSDSRNNLSKLKKSIKEKKSKKRGTEKEWYSKINNILFNTETIPIDKSYINKEDLYERKEKKEKVEIEKIIKKLIKNLNSSKNNQNIEEKSNEINRLTKKLQSDKRKPSITIARINKYVLKFIDDIAEPLLLHITKNSKKSKFLTKQGLDINLQERESRLPKIKEDLLEIFRRSFGDESPIPISKLFFNFFISFNRNSKYENFLKISYPRNNNNKDSNTFVISFA
jgi:hypothetical protein